MTELSYFWDGIVTGDAALAAPDGYTEQQFASVFSKILGSDAATGFIVPDYANELEVAADSPASANIEVNTGAASIKGMPYENTAVETLTIAANASGNPRIDRIILRIDWAAKEIRLAVLQGTPGATPALPTLTQVFGTTWETSLANIWVANGFVTITATEIHDERLFMPSFGMFINQAIENNLLTNSEYIVVGPSTAKPELWTTVGTYTAAIVAKPTQMYRSRAIQVTSSAVSSGFKQIAQVRGGEKYSLRGLINVTAGDVGVIEIVTDGASPLTVTKYIRRTGAYIDYFMYFTAPADATQVEVRLLVLNSTDVAAFGQFILVPGRIPGPYRPFREYIPMVTTFTLFNVDGQTTGTKSLHVPTVDSTNAFDHASIKSFVFNFNGNYSSGTTASVSMSIQTVGAGVTRQTIAISNTGAPVDTLRMSEIVMPYKEDKTYEVILAASASPVSFLSFFIAVSGVHT